MFESISRSIDIIKKSFGVLMSEKKLLLFPLFSGIAIIALFAFILVPSIFLPEGKISGYVTMGMIFLFYLLAYFVVIFFNSALVHAAKTKMEHKSVSLTESISFAGSRIVNILLWSLIAATVGLILSIIRGETRNRGGLIAIVGSLITSVLGAAWSVLTFFVIPVMVFEGVGPLSAIRKSFDLIKKTWGEQVVGGVGMGLVFFVLYLLGIGAIVLAIFVGAPVEILLPLGVAVAVYLIALFLIQSTLQGIFVTELYSYATTGQSEIFEENEIKDAFKGKTTNKPF